MFMHRIKLKNILSFGPNVQDLELQPLNVLIGPNGSGKSNFIEVLGLLKAAPTDLSAPLREGGGGTTGSGVERRRRPKRRCRSLCNRTFGIPTPFPSAIHLL